MIELIATMIIVGIMATTVLPRFASVNDFEAVGYAHQLQALLRFAQKSAIAQRRLIHLDFGGPTPSVSLAPSSTQCSEGVAMALPGNSPASPKTTVPVSVQGGDTKICFNSLGTPYLPNTALPLVPLPEALTIRVKHEDGVSIAKVIFVEADTGYVHE